MILTRLRSFRIPEPQASLINHARIELPSCNFAVDMMAWIAGDELAPLTPIREEELGGLAPLGLLPPNKPSKMLRVRTQGDEALPPLTAPVLYLRRRFQLIDDYLSDFPEAESIELSITRDEALSVLHPNEFKRVTIDNWLEVLEYLNPKDPTHYFFRSTIGMPRHLIERYASLIPEEVRWNIIKARRSWNAVNALLPNEGRGMSFLAHIFEVYGDVGNLNLFFSDYPSYLTLTAVNVSSFVSNPTIALEARKLATQLLLTTDYSEYDEIENVPNAIYADLITHMLCILSDATDWKAAKRFLTMMNTRHSLFGNLDDYVPGPYLHSVDANLNEFIIDAPFVVNLHKLLGQPREAILEALHSRSKAAPLA